MFTGVGVVATDWSGKTAACGSNKPASAAGSSSMAVLLCLSEPALVGGSAATALLVVGAALETPVSAGSSAATASADEDVNLPAAGTARLLEGDFTGG